MWLPMLTDLNVLCFLPFCCHVVNIEHGFLVGLVMCLRERWWEPNRRVVRASGLLGYGVRVSLGQRGGPPLISLAYLPNPVGSWGRGLPATTSATTTWPGHGQVHAEGSGGNVAIGSVWGLVKVWTEEMLNVV